MTIRAMTINVCLRAVVTAGLLAVAALPAFASDRDSGPAGAQGIGMPGGAYNNFSPARQPSRKVSGNGEFTKPESAKPAVREAGENAVPRMPQNVVIEREPMENAN